jgi:hypothetical protein
MRKATRVDRGSYEISLENGAKGRPKIKEASDASLEAKIPEIKDQRQGRNYI